MQRRLLASVAVAVTLLAPSSGLALEEVVVRAPRAEADLLRTLQRASVSARALRESEDDGVPPGVALSEARGEYRQMLGALYSEGYYAGTVSVLVDGREAAELSLTEPPPRVDRIVIEVDPGPRFVFGRADVSPLPPETRLPEGFATGEPAFSGVIREAGQTGVTAWRDAGHAKVVLSRTEIIARHRERRVDADLEIAPGPRLRFGPLVVSGNKRVRAERIRAIAGLPVGDVYDPETLDRVAGRLRRTGAFRAVTLADAERVGPNDTLPIELTVVEEKRRRLGVGVEVSSTEGLGLSAFWMHRNLLGGAENLRFDLEIQNIGVLEDDNGADYSLTGSFRRPATPITDMDLLFGGEISRDDEPGYLSDTVQFSGGFVYRFSDELEAEASLAYRGSRVEDAFGERDFQMLVFPSSITWDTRDDGLDPKRGFFLKGEARPFIGLADIENGAQLVADARTYFGFGEDDRFVAAGRVQFGSLFGPEIEDAPPDYLFFAGGGGSVRGQPYQSLGTGKVNGTIVGGRSYLALSAEMRARIRGAIGVVGFVDSGYIGTEELYDGSGEWMTGAGLGVRYDTGFGPIRVDVAAPVDGGPDDADPLQIYIGIGQAF